MLQSAMIAAFVRYLASLKLTCVVIAVLAAMVVATHLTPAVSRGWIALPCMLLAVNLLAALACNNRLRRSGALVWFHLALLAVCVLAAVAVLSGFEGRVELVEGQTFDADAVRIVHRGAWSGLPPASLALRQGPIDVAFEPGMVRQHTRSSVRTDGGPLRIIGDGTPLTIEGYRFSSSANKGFAVLLQWRGETGGVQVGTLNMPSYPALEWKQTQQWRTPAGDTITVSLNVPTPAPGRWSLRALRPGVSAQLRATHGVIEFRPGQPVTLRGGTLTLLDIRLWMGYRIDRQPVLPAMLACALLGIAALAWHVVRRHFLAPGGAPVNAQSAAVVARVAHV